MFSKAKENTNSTFKDTTRGGQITLHNIRMYTQVMKSLSMVVLCGVLGFNLLWFYVANSSYERYIAGAWLSAQVRLALPFENKPTQDFIEPNGTTYVVDSRKLIEAPLVAKTISDISVSTMLGLFLSFILSITGFSVGNYYLRKKGARAGKDKLLNGIAVVPPAQIIKMQKQRNQVSDIPIGQIHMVKGSEDRHMLIHGTTGSGKSTAIKKIIHQIEEMGDKYIVFDKSCDLTHHFYNPEKSIILNPFDERSATWTVWADARDSADLKGIAEALMPMPPGNSEPFWVNAAQLIFATTAFQMRNDPNKSNSQLLRNLLTKSLEEMEQFLANTEAANLVSEKIEKTAISIKSVMSTYLSSFKYLKDEGVPFSIREWLADDFGKKGLFITSLQDKHLVLRPLISMWLDIAINATMAQIPETKKRVWLILDEAHSLHRLPCLFDGANELRKFGGCIVLGTTSYAGLTKLYGHDEIKGILDQFNTSVYFTTPRAETATWVSRELGESEIEELHENISYGANSMRDGVSVQRNRVRRPAVPYSDIMNLKDLQAFVKLPGDYPPTKVDFEIYQTNHFKEPGFVGRHINEDSIKDIEVLEDVYINDQDNAPENKNKASRAGAAKTKKRNTRKKLNAPATFNPNKPYPSSERENVLQKDGSELDPYQQL